MSDRYLLISEDNEVRLRKAVDDLREVSEDLFAVVSETLANICSSDPQSERMPFVKVYSENPMIRRVLADFRAMADEGTLLGVHPNSLASSITVSGIAAIGLEAVGFHEAAKGLVDSIKGFQISEGSNRGALYAPDPSGQYRIHTWAHCWGFYSMLLVDPESVNTQPARDCVTFLLTHQDAKGGWGLSALHKPKPYYTAHALVVLMRAFALLGTQDAMSSDLGQAIERGIKYLCGTGDMHILAWSEGGSLDDLVPHFPTTLAVLLALEQYQKQFERSLYSRTAFDLAIHSYVKPQIDQLLQLKDVAEWPKVEENEVPTFHTWFSLPSAVSTLLNMGISAWDLSVIRALNWIEGHIVEERGVLGLDAGAPEPDRIVNWSTGHALIAIGAWEKLILESLSSPGFLADLVRAQEALNNLSSRGYVEHLRAAESSRDSWKRIAIVSMVFSAVIGIAVLVGLAVQNISVINAHLQSLLEWVKDLASNPIAGFVLGVIGVLPLLWAVVRMLAKYFGRNKTSDEA